MQTIVLASQKGGAGKSTTVRHLAVEAERTGEGPVALIDADPQGTLSEWWNTRKAETPRFIACKLASLQADLRKLERAGVRYAFIDTPPAITDTIRQVIKVADLVIVPTKPSPDDLNAIGRTIDLVEQAGKPMMFLVTQATKNARLTAHTQHVLATAAVDCKVPAFLAPSVIHHSVMFPGAAIGGQTVQEIDPESSPAREIAALWAYVFTVLTKQASKQAS